MVDDHRALVIQNGTLRRFEDGKLTVEVAAPEPHLVPELPSDPEGLACLSTARRGSLSIVLEAFTDFPGGPIAEVLIEWSGNRGDMSVEREGKDTQLGVSDVRSLMPRLLSAAQAGAPDAVVEGHTWRVTLDFQCLGGKREVIHFDRGLKAPHPLEQFVIQNQ
jgi:hypothetical protein